MSADNVRYFRDWAADIRKASGSSVDADRIDSAAAEIEKLRDIIARRLACDGSNGVWDARKNYELTEEMRAAVSPSPVTDATAIISNALGTKPSIGEEAGPLSVVMGTESGTIFMTSDGKVFLDESKND